MKRALFSVYDKTGIEDFAKYLTGKGYEIISSGGTFRHLKEKGIAVIEIKDVTGFPEVLGGRVKTLHPFIHAGILAVRDDPAHMKDLESHGIVPIDMVICNLYPFEATVSKDGVTDDEIVEQIDIGGVTLLRAAAKNHKYVTVIVDNKDFQTVQTELDGRGDIGEVTRLDLARKAFNHTAYYDALISTHLSRVAHQLFPDEFAIPMKKEMDLRYGENPHQLAALYRTYVEKNNTVLNAEILWGKKLSYNNVMDADAALDIVREWAAPENKPFCVVMKHTNPCGAAFADNLTAAYERAFAGDPRSAFGGIIGFNRKVDKTTAEKVIDKFCEIVIAPDYDADALEVFQTKKNLRILRIPGEIWEKKGVNYRRIENGMLVQEWDEIGMQVEKMETVTETQATPEQMRDLEFAWKICQYVKSNAIVYVKDEQVIGVGAGQMSRLDSAKIGVEKAVEFELDLNGSVMASDAFFPFRDSVDEAAKIGVKAIIQPGGSIRDLESVTAANEHKIAMVFTNIRHFKH